MSSRILKVNPGQYDQVVAVTQAMINAGMENLYLAKTPDPPKPQIISIRAAGAMNNVTLKAPRIIVSPVQNNLSQVIYVMGFSAGTLAVYSTDGSDPATEDDKTNYDMTNWKFAFAVDLGLSKLDPTTQAYKDVRAKINQPGNYTVTQLLVDLSTAGISEFNIKQSYFGGRDWSKESQDVQDNFSVLIKKAIGQIFTLGLNNVGYLASTDAGTTGDHPATFLPTDVRFQTYPWVTPAGVEVGPGITGNSVLNYLCYLEMTDKRAPPTGTNAVLIPNGNWTDGDASNLTSMDQGTFILSKRNFLDRWFIPQLRAMNQILEPTVTKIPISVTIDGLWLYWKCNPDMQLGYNSAHPSSSDPYFDFKPASPYTVPTDIPNVIQKGTYECYQFTSSFTAPNTFDQAGAGGALAKVWGSADCKCTNRLLYKAGSSQIILLGTAYIHSYFSRWAPLWDAPSSKDDDIKYTYNWSVVFNLESVKDGGLQITPKVTQSDPVKTLSIQDGIGSQLVKYFDSAFPIATKRFTSFQNNLSAALAGQQKFYFPASGTFFFKNPVLNYQGDLVASVGYNGTDAPIPGVPDRSTAQNTKADLPAKPAGIDTKLSK